MNKYFKASGLSILTAGSLIAHSVWATQPATPENSRSLFESTQPPVLLYDSQLIKDGGQLDLETAQTLCQQYKVANASKYFYVYCVYGQKDTEHIELEAFDNQTLMVLAQRGPISITAMDQWTSLPVTVTDSIFDLSVFGWGDVQSSVVLAESLGLGNGLVDRIFPNEAQANLACHQRLQQEQIGSSLFAGAQCQVLPVKNSNPQNYYYQISTHNPIVNHKE